MQIDRRSEMLLYMAARAQLVDEVIRPALADEMTVISDRFLLANVVYQAHAGGLSVDLTWQVGAVATGGLEPDLTLLLDMDVDRAFARLGGEHDRMEAQGVEYLKRVRDGFLLEAGKRSDTICVIDAGQSIESIHAEIRQTTSPIICR
jgi:dTMP kinase